MFARGEATLCPSCGLALTDLARLPPSHDALAERDDFGIPPRPDLEPLPFAYFRRGRGVLAACAVLGLAAFWMPWVHRTAPEVDTLGGFDIARHAGVVFADAVAWFVLLPLVLSRRSIDRMRGARVAAAGLACIPIVVVSLLLTHPPRSRVVPIAFTWGAGLWLTLGLGAVATVAGALFGGRGDDLPVPTGRSRGRVMLN